MRSSNTRNVLIVIIIALIMTLSLFGGYKVITLLSPAIKEKFDVYTEPVVSRFNEVLEDNQEEEQEDEHEDDREVSGTFEYSGPVERDYNGPKIYETKGYIYNSDGKLLSDYRNENGTSLRITMNADRSEAVLLYEKKCLYIDAELNVTEIADNCKLASACFDGGYLFYYDSEDGLEQLHIYNIATKEDHLIAENDSSYLSVCISPDGRTLVYSIYATRTQIHVKGIDIPEQVYETKNAYSIVSVSNDGETVFYYDFDDETIYYCLNKGEITKLGDKNYEDDYLTRDCKQILYLDRKGRVMYYRAGAKKPVTVCKEKDARILVTNVAKMSLDLYMQDYIIDVDTFSDAVMITSHYKCFALTGYEPEAVEMLKDLGKAHSYTTRVTNQGATCLFMYEGSLMKAVYNNGSVESSTLFEFSGASSDYTCSEDLSEIWVRDKKAFYYVEEGKDPVCVMQMTGDSRFTTFTIEWDPIKDKCYYIIDEVLSCVGKDENSVEAVMEGCDMISGYVPGDLRIMHFTDTSNNQYLIIKDEIVTY